MSALIPMNVNNVTVTVPYTVTMSSFDINHYITNGLGPFVHSITQPPSGHGSLARDPNIWDRYQYTKPFGVTGTFTATLTVTDANSETDTAVVTFNLQSLPTPVISITGASDVYPQLGTAYSTSYQLDGGVAPYTWSLVSGTLPNGLTFSGGTLSGVVTELGLYPIRISVTDSSTVPITKTKDVNIRPGVALEIQAPVIPNTWYRTKPYDFVFTALTDANLAGLLDWAASGLPYGMALSVGSPRSTARLMGTPTNNGVYNPSITVVNSLSGDSDYVTLSFTVVDWVDGVSASSDAVSTAYNTSVTIDVMVNDTGANISIIGLSTPGHGTAVVSAGKVVYTPAVGFSGDDTFVYTLSDGSTTAQGTVTVTVGAPGVVDAPLITNAPSGDIAVQQGDAYSLTLTATGGVPPYRWGISSSSSAINWLTVNSTTGALAGTFNNPSATPGYTNTFLVTVTDTSIPPKSDMATLSFVLGESPYTATIQGTLRLDTSTGAFAARKVYLYNYTTGAKVAETTSNGTTGAWEFTAVAPGEYFVVGVAQGDDLNIPRDFDAMGVITVT